MKKNLIKSFVALSVIGAMTVGGFATAFAAPNTSTTKPAATPAPAAKDYVGYLMDGHCAKTGVDDETGKINLKLYPEKHTTSCLKIDMCMMEGLGIMVKEGKVYKYYKFDKAGSKKADDTIMMMTKRKFGNKIAVKGTIKGDTMTITSVKEAK